MTVSFRQNPAKEIYEISEFSEGKEFDVTFGFLKNPDYVEVYIRHKDSELQQLKLGTDYTMFDITENSAKIKMLKKYENIQNLTINRNIRMSQDTRYNSQTIFSDTVEKDLDKLTMLMQDSNFILRTIHAAVDNNNESETSVIDRLQLPSRVDRAGKVLTFDIYGTLITKPLSELTNSVRQPNTEEPDPSFEISKDSRKNKCMVFDNKGSLVLTNIPSAGANMQISADNVYSATDTKYTANVGIEINNNAIRIKPAKTGNSEESLGGVIIKDVPENFIRNENGYISVIIPIATATKEGLLSPEDKLKLNHLKTVAITGNYDDLINQPGNASIDSDGFMSKEDKVKLDAAMKFPDGETGCVLPDKNGRKNKVIVFNDNGDLSPHYVWEYDNWRNIRIPISESLSEVNIELPDSSVRANKVIGFNADGKSIEMKSSAEEQVNSDWSATSGKAQILNKPNLSKVALSNNYNDLDNKLVAGMNITIDNNNVISAGGADITAGQGLQKNGNEISLRPVGNTNQLGGIYRSYHPENDLLTIEPDGQAYAQLPHAARNILGGIKVGSGLDIDGNGILSATGGGDAGDEFINEPVFTGDMVSKRIVFVNRGNTDYVDCVASFVINGKKTFFVGKRRSEDGKLYDHIRRSNDCVSWHEIPLDTYIYSDSPLRFNKGEFIQSGNNIIYINGTYNIFLSSDGGYTFNKTDSLTLEQGFHGWCEHGGVIVIGRTSTIVISTDSGKTWNAFVPDIPDIGLTKFSSPVYVNDMFFFIVTHGSTERIMSLERTSTIYRIAFHHTFINNHIPQALAVASDAMLYVVVKDGTGYPQSFIYESYKGSSGFNLRYTYNNTYTQLMGTTYKWLLIDSSGKAWFCKTLSSNPLNVHSLNTSESTKYHYSATTDLFMIYDMELFVSTTEYHIGG